MQNIFKGRGEGLDRMTYIDFINYVFGFNGHDTDFLKLLPKLYKEQYEPCYNSFVVTEDGEYRAAIGCFPRKFMVGDEELVSHGIGNVAVHPRHRSKGYMKDCLHNAIASMIEAGADFSDLGGQRQRYGYFSYEKGSSERSFHITDINLRYAFGKAPLKDLTFKVINDENDPLIEGIWALHNTRKVHAVRPKEAFLDIARSWESTLTAIMAGERLVGYYIGGLGELTLADSKDFDDVIRNYVKKFGNATFHVPSWDTAMSRRAWELCEGTGEGNVEMVTIFHFAKVVKAFLKLKAGYAALKDGSVVYHVSGVAGEENFRITVKDNAVTVEATDDKADVTLEHHAAISYFFGSYSTQRGEFAGDAGWFPLDMYFDSADHV